MWTVARRGEDRDEGLFNDTWTKHRKQSLPSYRSWNVLNSSALKVSAQPDSPQYLPFPLLPLIHLYSSPGPRLNVTCSEISLTGIPGHLLRQSSSTALSSASCDIFTCVLICLISVLIAHELLRIGATIVHFFVSCTILSRHLLKTQRRSKSL